MQRLSIKQKMLKTSNFYRQKEIAIEWHTLWSNKMKRELSAAMIELENSDMREIFWRLIFVRTESNKYYSALPNVLDVLDISNTHRAKKSEFENSISELIRRLNIDIDNKETLAFLKQIYYEHLSFSDEIVSVIKNR